MTYDKLDDKTDGLLTAVSGLAALVEGKDTLLAKLASGHEAYWDDVATLARQGQISKKDAFEALGKCLDAVIPQYQSWIGKEVTPKGYWAEKTQKAMQTRTELYDSKMPVVQYRGIPLMKEGPIVAEGPKSVN